MRARWALLALLLCPRLEWCLPYQSSHHTSSRRPQTVLVTIIDDLGFGDVGYNNPNEMNNATPTLNRLCAQGVNLQKFYVSPTCTASRAALMTGRYPVHLGLQDSIIHPSEPRGVPLHELFLSDKLRSLGFKTAFVGKWHLGFHQRDYTPLRRGFDTFFGILTGGGDHYTHESSTSYAPRGPLYKSRVLLLSGANLWRDDAAVSGEHTGIHTTELYTTRAVELINNTEAPLFLVVSYQAVHAPIQAPAAQECQLQPHKARRAMCAMIKMVDDSLRELEASLISSQRWDNTAWFVLSDNGGVLRHGSSNGNLRGEKGSYYEGGIRVPAFFTGGLATSKVFDGLFHVTDVHATLLVLAGGRLDDQQPLDGIDQSACLIATCTTFPRTEIVHNVNSELFGSAGAIRIGPYKLVVEARVTESEIYEYGMHMLQDDNWDEAELSQVIHQKLLRSPGLVSLFNVERNPNEVNRSDCAEVVVEECRNLVDIPAYATLKTRLMDRLDKLRMAAVPSTEQWTDDGPLADPQLFGGVWSPWRDDQNLPYATYQLSQFSLHSNLGVDKTTDSPATAASNTLFSQPHLEASATPISRRRYLLSIHTQYSPAFLFVQLVSTVALGFFLGRRSRQRS